MSVPGLHKSYSDLLKEWFPVPLISWGTTLTNVQTNPESVLLTSIPTPDVTEENDNGTNNNRIRLQNWNNFKGKVSNTAKKVGSFLGSEKGSLMLKTISSITTATNPIEPDPFTDTITTALDISNNPILETSSSIFKKVNSIGSKRTEGFQHGEYLAAIGGSYGSAKNVKGINTGLFNKKARDENNKEAAKQKVMAPHLAAVYKNNEDIIARGQNEYTSILYRNNSQGLNNYLYAFSARIGGILEKMNKPKIEVTIEEIIPIEKFEKGGSFNIIPEGALHARKHNLDIEGITKKGIPVISETEDGKIELHAEIEQSEIIFRLEVTKKLEEMSKEFSNDEKSQKEKDEIAIEAGKLLVDEILNNTDDKTNLINEIVNT